MRGNPSNMGDTADVPPAPGAGAAPAQPSSHEVPVRHEAEASKRAQAPAASSEVGRTPSPAVRTPREAATAVGVVNFAVIPLRGPVPPEQLERLSTGLTVLSLILVVIGVVAVAAPLLFSLVIEQFLGVLFVLGGIVQVVHGLQMCGVSAPGCSMNLLLGGLNLFVGVWLVTSPVEGLAGLTLLIAAWFFASGLSKLVLAYQVRHLSTWPSVLVSGLLSLALAVLILAQWPASATWVVGVLVGVDFVVTGAALGLVACMANLGMGVDRASLAGLPTEPLLAGEG
ncbi:hypothetical protein KFL_000010080 [Klebsormidium nitens]|uniref:HdeD family acid-resistance protein n=1 Tax=Klebsormidium nitens TaxID=105231 RepID=A0A0U9HPK4_KLENI|nr:hypothetical protein KFL_000010080 [Klebsormidium nitens]|eukprot:GAQ77559.1 hypothetical protein KFL_000010080 [Klebsormidium nitens]